jgi:hypothetical protein
MTTPASPAPPARTSSASPAISGTARNGPALTLHGAAAQALGLVMLRSSAAFTVEVFRRELIAGIQAEVSARGFGLALQFVADLDEEGGAHRRWRAEQRVDGVLLIDPRTGDPRTAVADAIALPAVLIGGTQEMNGLGTDDEAATTAVVDYLIGAGHRRLARVSGPAGTVHTERRDAAFRRAPAEVTIVAGDYTGAAGARLTPGAAVFREPAHRDPVRQRRHGGGRSRGGTGAGGGRTRGTVHRGLRGLSVVPGRRAPADRADDTLGNARLPRDIGDRRSLHTFRP